MKQNIFSKKNQLDEMQEQTLRKIESRGFWLMWWGLFAVMIFQLMMQADISQVAGEWIVFMAACLYTLEECLRNGIWDRHIKASLSTSIVGSLVGGVLSAVVMMFGDRNPHQKCAVRRRDFGIGHFGPPVQPAHLVAGFAERNVAPLQPADHLGGIVGIDKVGDTGHAQCAERGGAALDVEVHEDAAEVEYYVFDLIHKLL